MQTFLCAKLPQWRRVRRNGCFHRLCVAKWLTPWTADLEVFKPRQSHCFLSQRNFTPLCLSSPRCINGYRRHTAGGNPATSIPSRGGVAISRGMHHANETRISSSQWAFGSCMPFPFYKDPHQRQFYLLWFIVNGWALLHLWTFSTCLTLHLLFSRSPPSAPITPHMWPIMICWRHPWSHVTWQHTHGTWRARHRTSHHGSMGSTRVWSRGTHHHRTGWSWHGTTRRHTGPVWSPRAKRRNWVWSVMSERWSWTPHSMFWIIEANER